MVRYEGVLHTHGAVKIPSRQAASRVDERLAVKTQAIKIRLGYSRCDWNMGSFTHAATGERFIHFAVAR